MFVQSATADEDAARLAGYAPPEAEAGWPEEPPLVPATPSSMLRRMSFFGSSESFRKQLETATSGGSLDVVPAAPRAPRRRAWVVVDEAGTASLTTVDKSYVTGELGVPARDLRVLDPFAPLPYSTAVFIRETAIVLNLEAVKAIVTKERMFLLAVPYHEASRRSRSVWDEPRMNIDEKGVAQVVVPTRDHPFVVDLCRRIRETNVDNLPFPLLALEAAMAGAHKQLEVQVTQLETSVRYALEHLVQKVSRTNLERVHVVKSHMNKLTTRADKLKEEIDKLLDDDDDMRDLYLKPQPAEAGKVQHTEEPVMPHVPEHPPDGPAPADADHALHSPREAGAEAHFAEGAGDGVMVEGQPVLHASSGVAVANAKGAAHPEPGEGQPGLTTVSSMQRGTHRRPTNRNTRKLQDIKASMRKSKSENNLVGKAPVPHRTSTRFHASSIARAPSNASVAKLDAGGLVRPPSEAALPRSTSAKIVRVRNLKAYSGLKKMPGSAGLAPHAHGGGRQQAKGFPVAPRKNRTGHADVQEAEALLEVYVTSVEFLQSRLQFLKDRIDDTEDLINIELDSRYNELQAVNVNFLIFSLSWSFTAVAVAVMGQNLCTTCHWHTDSGPDSNPWLFFVTIAYIAVVMAAIAMGFFIYIQVKGLSFIPGFQFFSTTLDKSSPAAFKPWWTASS